MEHQLLETKLFVPPVRAKLVCRPRLLERFRLGHKSKITLVVAPAGYGKTTLVCQCLRSSSIPFGWLTLDKDDNDPKCFWSYVISAIQTVRADMGKSVLSLLESEQITSASIKFIIIDIINEIAKMNQEFILVLDDFQVIQSNKIRSALEFFINHMPSQIHLVIASRSYPALPLSRLRACGLLNEFCVDDLRFTNNETTNLLNDVMELGLSDDDIAALNSYIEGWVAGLQMVAVSMQGRKDMHTVIANLKGSRRHIRYYLIEEVLSKQKASTLSFLLETAVLNRFTASLCNAVTGREDGQEMLELLESNNVFLVPLDNEHKWYRYHHVFAALLQKQLLKSQQTYIAELNLRASKWFDRNGLTSEAIQHAFAAQDCDLAASLIDKTAKEALCAGSAAALLNWLEKLPPELLYERPRLGIYYAWMNLSKGNIDLAEEMLCKIRQILEAMPDSSENNMLMGELATILTMIAAQRYDINEATKEANEAFTRLPDGELISRARATMALGIASQFNGNTENSIQLYEKAKDLALKGGHDFLAVYCAGALAQSFVDQGRLTKATKCLQQIIELGEQHEARQFPPVGIGYISLAMIYLERNDIYTAAQYIDRGTELCQLLNISYCLLSAYYANARFKLAMGDRSGALDKLYQIEQLDFNKAPYITSKMAEYETRIRLLLNDLEMALHWAKSYADILRDKIPGKIIPPPQYEIQQILLAKVYTAMGRHEEAIEICDQIHSSVESRGHVGMIIDIGLIEAIAMQAQRKVDKALNILEYTLSLAKPEGYVRIFIDEGKPMQMLLQEATSCGIQPEYVNRLLSAFTEVNSELRYLMVLPERPSKRETEVLKLIESGMSNRMIAQELVLSESTIKTHINNLYGKLGVQSRTQAILRAKELNLL